MLEERLSDLDELILRCKEEPARQYIAEAVACYRAGAYRACIVSTWTAVVFDFLHKLRQLELAGDGRARVKLEEFERARSSNELTRLQAFENSVLTQAKDDFELLTPLEYDSLERLHQDRHLCAHPSMLSSEEPFQPTAELARYHLRNAICCLLQHPPVQGRSAIDRIWSDIRSNGFPRSTAEAVQYFQSGPLRRARENLIRDLVTGLTKDLLNESRSIPERERQYAALNAILSIHHEIGERTLNDKLSDIVREVKDDTFPQVFTYLRNVEIAWNCQREFAILRVKNQLQNASPEQAPTILADAVHIAALRDLAVKRMRELPVANVASQPGLEELPETIESMVMQFVDSNSFLQARENIHLLIPVASHLTADQVKRIVKAYGHNNQIHNCFGMASAMRMIWEETTPHTDEAQEEWEQVYYLLKGMDYDPEKGKLQYRIGDRFHLEEEADQDTNNENLTE